MIKLIGLLLVCGWLAYKVMQFGWGLGKFIYGLWCWVAEKYYEKE